jgi:hypothetical protein
LGFESGPARWSGKVVSQTARELVSDTARPSGWPPLPAGVANYVLTWTDSHPTGFPARAVGRRRIGVDRFPLPGVDRFELLAVRYCQR